MNISRKFVLSKHRKHLWGGGGGDLQFFRVQEPTSGFLHISLRKFRANLLPRGFLGIEGLKIFRNPYRGL